jgi:hypothetical protein
VFFKENAPFSFPLKSFFIVQGFVFNKKFFFAKQNFDP